MSKQLAFGPACFADWPAALKTALIQCLLIVAILLPPARAAGTDVLAKLSAHEFSALESHYEDVEARFERRELSEREWVDAYHPFYRNEDTLSAHFAAWIEQRPSFVAHLIRGIYLRKLGDYRRGELYGHQTPAADLQYMAQMHIRAKADLLAALQLRPGSYIAAFHLLNIAQFEGDSQAARTYLDIANKAVPGNLLARARYLVSLAPKWNGSLQQMEAFIEEAKADGVTEQQGRWLEAIEREERARVAFYSRDDAGAASNVTEAFRLAADAGQRFQSDYLTFSSWYRKAGQPTSSGDKSQRPWWAYIVQWTAWGIAMSALMGWVARSRLKQRPQQLADELRHPTSTLVIGVVGFVFFAALGVLSNTIGKNPTTSVWTSGVFLLFSVMALASVADYFLARHRLMPDGLEFGRLLGRRGKFSWNDVSSVEYASLMKWFKVRTRQGATIRISAMLMGLPAFAQQVLAHVPAKQIAEPARSILEETAAGRPPSVWD